MRHKKKGRKLGRKVGNRKALLMNLACQLIIHKKIKTTDPKAKELRTFIEPLITLAKKNDLHSRRLAIKKIPKKNIVRILFEEIAPVFEFGVGVMLVFLGAQVFWNLYKKNLHVHHHEHDGNQHLHIHGAHDESEDSSIEKSHSLFNPGKPFFRLKSFKQKFLFFDKKLFI